MNKKHSNTKRKAVLQALLVTVIWSSSWVLIKFGLQELPPITFAGLRYFLAFLVLLLVFLRSPARHQLKQMQRKDWVLLCVLGFVFYTLTQGLQFIGLSYLPAITLSLLLNFTAIITAGLGVVFLKERLNYWQWMGLLVFLGGVALYFYPVQLSGSTKLGLLIGFLMVLSASVATALGRYVNRELPLSPITVTVVSMGIGSSLLLFTGLLKEEWQPVSPANWGLILVLAVVNTAFTFSLWNHTQRELTAAESSLINNTMLIQIALLAWWFLDETPSKKEWAGMLVVALGVAIVTQMADKKPPAHNPPLKE